MINADARSRITPQDLDLLGITVDSDGVARKDLDRVLDRREVVAYLMGASQGSSVNGFLRGSRYT